MRNRAYLAAAILAGGRAERRGRVDQAIVQAPSERTLVVACDMPYLTEHFIRPFAIEDGDLVAPRDAAANQPLCAVYGRACEEPLRERLACGEHRVAPLPEGVRIVEIGPDEMAAFDPDGLLFVNVNTPHDYERAGQMRTAAGRPYD